MMSTIARVEVHEFEFDATNLARDGASLSVTYKKGTTTRLSKYAVSIHTDDGGRGDYVALWVSSPAALGQTLTLAPRLIGKDARERIGIYEDLKRDIRQFDHMGHGAIDIALWDWAGRHYGASISELLGGYRKRLPAYASTYHGDRAGGLSSPRPAMAWGTGRSRSTAGMKVMPAKRRRTCFTSPKPSATG
jgi:L-alanine-DL-glutamate epimerase-like enolase superfamily enzyme